MPPGGHSHSSHSSHSHSSSHSSHSHSHSSHSSSYRSSSGGYGRASSVIKHTAPYIGIANFARTRINQPNGFKNYDRVIGYKCKKHEYVYYPTDWVSETNAKPYKHGYYDENGDRYETLILKHNQMYENVPLVCDYCGTTAIRDLTDDNEVMKCDNCGANMRINAILDERDEADVAYTAKYGDGSYTAPRPNKAGKIVLMVFLIYLGVQLTGGLMSCLLSPVFYLTKQTKNTLYPTTTQQQTTQTTQAEKASVSNVDIYGSTIYLSGQDNTYSITEDKDNCDKILRWDYGYESYYDIDSDCYVWYNTDVTPNLWQYWYEGISSDYGDYGWMEYEDGKWYIEVSNENWKELDTNKYDTSNLWHFESAY